MLTLVNINELPALPSVSGTEEFPVEKNGVTYKTTINQVAESGDFIHNETANVQQASYRIKGPSVIQPEGTGDAYIVQVAIEDETPVLYNVQVADGSTPGALKSVVNVGNNATVRVTIDGEDGLILNETEFATEIDHVVVWDSSTQKVRTIPKNDFISESQKLSFSTKTGDYTLVMTDAFATILVNSASPVEITIPAEASVDFPIGTQISFEQIGTGQLSILIDSDTLDSYSNMNKLAGQFAVASVYKKASGQWTLFGNLTA